VNREEGGREGFDLAGKRRADNHRNVISEEGVHKKTGVED
jgi:hypothetical protein